MKKHITSLLLLLCFAVLSSPAFSAMPKVERIELSNKLVVLVFEDHSLPAVTTDLLVSAGSRLDPKRLEGLANLTAKSLLVGTKGLSFSQINDRLDFLGAGLDANCRREFVEIGLQVLKKDLDSGFNLLMEILTAPSFPEADVIKEKDNIAGKLRSDEDDPAQVANKAFEKALFLDGPYGSPVEGTEESLSRIGIPDVKEFYNTYYKSGDSILVIGGDITSEEVRSTLVSKLLQYEQGEIPPRQFSPSFATAPLTVRINRPVSQATIVIGGPGMERSNKDYYAFVVLNNILGSGDLNSRLMTSIRVKAGLAYAVESAVLARRHTGSFRIILQTKNESAKEAIDLALKEIERIRTEPVSEAELDRAKKFLIGNFPLRYLGTTQDYAKFIAQVEFLGLGRDYPEKYPSLINNVTVNDILRIAKKYLDPADMVTVVVADLEKAGMK